MNRESEAWNRSLVGQPGGRARIDTPALVLDLDAFEANVATMAKVAADHGVALRPHGKTHKSVEIGRRQLAAGAVGICCAKLAEAEALAAGGIDRLLITSPVMGPSKIRRLLDLNARLRDLMVVADDAAHAKELAEAAAGAGQTLRLLIVVDVGGHRFGATSTADVLEIARLAAASPALKLEGVQGYAGHLQHIADYETRRSQSRTAIQPLRQARDALREAGFSCPVVTGAGTGTHDFDHETGLFTDLQVGSYMFMDSEYDAVQLTADGSRRFRNSLFVATRVVSARHAGFVTTDAGSKSFAVDGPKPVPFSGAPEGSTYAMNGDQFGRLTMPEGATAPGLGTLVACVVPHCDPTVNLYDVYTCVRGDRVEALWAVDGRGGTA
jgi:D-serine deaminase-like pyridoxal phosphate-dependent protein